MKRAKLRLFHMKLKVSTRTLAWLSRRPKYLAFALGVSLLFFEFVYWMFNLPMLWTLLTSLRLSLMDKLALFTGPFTYVQNQNGLVTFSLMLSLALIQGLSIATVVYAIRHQPKTDSKLLGGSAVVGFLALVGLGCPACGTSLITPIVAIFVSGSTVAVSEQITAIALPAALLIGLYGLYVVGLRASTVKAYADSANAAD